MNKHIKVLMIVMIAISITLSSCELIDGVALGFGYVSKSQLDEVNNKLVKANEDLLKAQADQLQSEKMDHAELISVNAKLFELARELTDTKAELSEWQKMRCIGPDGKIVQWNDMINKYFTYPPVKKYRSEKLTSEWHFKVVQTQWKSYQEFNPYGEMDVILIDNLYPDSLAINITKDCVILGPNFIP